jgi:hypothetical protein
MNKKIFLFSLALFVSVLCAKAQVTIGSVDDPKATLDVRKGTEKADGIIPPVLTGDELAGNDAKYGTDQTGAIVYVTAAVASPTTKTANVTAAGYYYFDGALWQTLKGSGSGIGTEVDGIIGNEILDATNETLVRSGSGTGSDPYKIARAAITGDVSVPAASNNATLATVSTTTTTSAASPSHGETFTVIDGVTTDGKGRVTSVNTKTVTLPADNNTTYTGSTSVYLTGGSFQREELTGDVTASRNSNATTIADNAVTSAKIADNTITRADMKTITSTSAVTAASGWSVTSSEAIKVGPVVHIYVMFTRTGSDITNFVTDYHLGTINNSAFLPVRNVYTGISLGATSPAPENLPASIVGVGAFYDDSRILLIGGAQPTTTTSDYVIKTGRVIVISATFLALNNTY